MSRINTLVREEHLCIISDLHLGNPSFVQGKNLDSFLKYLSEKIQAFALMEMGLIFYSYLSQNWRWIFIQYWKDFRIFLLTEKRKFIMSLETTTYIWKHS